jgi:hypothetical protein
LLPRSGERTTRGATLPLNPVICRHPSRLHDAGVASSPAGTKLWKDVSKLFERMGWQETERPFTKVV